VHRDRIVDARLDPTGLQLALKLITPASFLMSGYGSSRYMVDRLALGLGLAVGGALALLNVAFDLVWTGIIAGTLAWLVQRVRTRRE